jgi:hypothetical protein
MFNRLPLSLEMHLLYALRGFSILSCLKANNPFSDQSFFISPKKIQAANLLLSIHTKHNILDIPIKKVGAAEKRRYSSSLKMSRNPYLQSVRGYVKWKKRSRIKVRR